MTKTKRNKKKRHTDLRCEWLLVTVTTSVQKMHGRNWWTSEA